MTMPWKTTTAVRDAEAPLGGSSGDVTVAVISEVPSVIAVIVPSVSTVATAVLLDVHATRDPASGVPLVAEGTSCFVAPTMSAVSEET